MADNERSELRDGGAINKILITNLASMVIMFLVFTGVFYLIMDNMMTKKIANIQISQEELEESDEGDEIERGIIVDLGDFILNLCDEAQKKYLKVNVAIEVSQKETDFAKEEPAKSGGHGGHGEAPLQLIQWKLFKKKWLNLSQQSEMPLLLTYRVKLHQN